MHHLKGLKPALTTTALGAAALLLGACEGMIDNEQMYQQFAETCESQFTSEGGPAELAKPFCECSADKAREQELGPMDMLDQEKMEALATECANTLMPEGSGG